VDAADWDRRYAAEDLVWGADPNRFVVDLVSGLVPGDAVDLACGEGRNAVWLARQGWRVTALDFSPVALARGARLAAEAGVEVDWREVDVERRTVPEADLVLLAYLHLPPRARTGVLRAAAAAVRPGGALVLVGHDRRNLGDGVGGPQDADLLWTAAELQALADAEGLAVEVAEVRARAVQDRTAWDTVGLLRRG
jgi:SAM-dependent methyltransferase